MDIRDLRGGFAWLNNAVIDEYLPTIGCTALAVYMVLCRYANNDSGKCWPGQETLASTCGLTDRTIRTAIQSLIDNGLVSVEKIKTTPTSYPRNVYSLHRVTEKSSEVTGSQFPVVLGATGSLLPIATGSLLPMNNTQVEQDSKDSHSTNHKEIDIPKLFEYFCQQAGKSKNYTLTQKRESLALRRWREAKKIAGGDVAEAKQLLRRAIDALCGNDFMHKQGLVEWDQVFRSEDNFTKWLDRWETQPEGKTLRG